MVLLKKNYNNSDGVCSHAVVLLPLVLNKKKLKHRVSWHLDIVQKSTLLSHFYFVCLIKFSIISPCLGKVKVLILIILVDVQRLHENGTLILCVSNGVYT